MPFKCFPLTIRPLTVITGIPLNALPLLKNYFDSIRNPIRSISFRLYAHEIEKYSSSHLFMPVKVLGKYLDMVSPGFVPQGVTLAIT